ncbi:DUF4191 family protein [Tropheryma whipplei]|uniref:DUF4191 family protein n=1 Tax=Tropheryma whipplei TaxID=2039 RepID=UPI0004B598F6|nr:DUF4191 family protein [Tropheryma whipplei]MCO8183056.1 DUF4191 family protein [Tropheryma whipplei]MCO8190695.1 DUF4191 family protein [Tropheryma whipplei]
MPKSNKKAPGRIAQIMQVLRIACSGRPKVVVYLIAAGITPLVAGISAAVILAYTSILVFILLILISVGAALLSFMITLGKQAEKVAYSQVEGRPGATGAVIKTFRGCWQTSEIPVAVNPKTADAIYRAVGKCGVVLIIEGMRQRAQKMLAEEQRRVKRVLPNIQIHVLNVNHLDPKSVPLNRLGKRMRSLKKTLHRSEVWKAGKLLDAIPKNYMPVPKGMDLKKPVKRPSRG